MAGTVPSIGRSRELAAKASQLAGR
jgi:hypothetical protein